MTKEKSCDIMLKLSHRRQQGPWKLNNIKKRTEACEGITLDILLKKWVNTIKTLLSNFETLMRLEKWDIKLFGV